MLALELNDAQLVLATLVPAGRDAANATQILASAPGMACVTDSGIVVGAAATAQARLLPQRIQHRYWRDLSTQPLGRAPNPQLSAADLAFEQLRALFATAAGATTRLVIAVPAGLSREQLGLLLGIATEAGAGEIGLVDAALASCALTSVPQHVLHLELYRHYALVTAIEQTVGGARRTRFEMDEQCGVQRLEQLCTETVAAQFVRQTRFDPLHQARTEQLLSDAVPPLLAALQAAEQSTVTLNADRDALQVEISRGQWLATAEPIFAALLQLVQRARPAGQSVELRVGARAQAFPGLVERLQSLQSCVISQLPEGAAARGALAHGAAILRGGEPALICQLPLAHLPEAAIPEVLLRQPSAHAAATHLLYGGRAWPLGSEALTLGTQAPHGVRALSLPAGSPGISRSHCRVRLRDGVAIVEDLSTYGTFINDERVHGSATLQRGDRLRLGTPGQVLDAIAVVCDDAAPSL